MRGTPYTARFVHNILNMIDRNMSTDDTRTHHRYARPSVPSVIPITRVSVRSTSGAKEGISIGGTDCMKFLIVGGTTVHPGPGMAWQKKKNI